MYSLLSTAVSTPISLAKFRQICAARPDLRLERDSQGELIQMAPAGSETGRQNADLIYYFVAWNRQARLGLVFDSSAGFLLPNGAVRSPYLAWVSLARWQQLTDAEKQGFAPICPDFVLELASPSDHLPTLQAKMSEYINNGARLGWLIVPLLNQAWVYRPEQVPVMLERPTQLTGDEVLPNFVLDLTDLWHS
ncbi:Uma2 family endonuclease [Thermosynechococcaceae cyanobacterium BACA0444]|uniref:Uma2 family endonuclease n=1 Tax=Pseudocalidococcus azoricus BACA0444 TaxID=2918990 RepID=A0AAE4FTS0_9CYAN|nr:Uma2 family endonuclease [Pseudocalidococcus azoricus]MDS3860826.1 Uma2 family endonuclease [Pseudocalidococcus azoricus BACA0444]